MSYLKSVVSAIFVVACFLVISTSAFANTNTDFSNIGGSLTGSSTGLTLTGSILSAVNGYPGLGFVTGTLGTVSFTTGALTSGSLQMGGTFAAGGTFTIDGNGTNGVPSGTLFSGMFSEPLTWTLTTLSNGTHNYTLTGVITGTLGTMTENGVTVQLTINTGTGFFTGSTLVASGDTTVSSPIPESSTLAMLGTGILGLAGVLRRKGFGRS